MTYLLRLVLPDRPGMLGAVASALGGEGADILSVDVVERGHGVAVDDLVVDLPSARPPDVLITSAESVPEVSVESLRPFAGSLDTARELELVEAVTAAPAEGLGLLAEDVPRIYRCAWALVVAADPVAATGAARPGGAGTGGAGTGGAGTGAAGTGGDAGGTRVRRLAASPAAPATEADRLPWLPLARATVLDPSAGHAVPGAWTDLDTELAACPLGRPDRVLVVGRPGGPAFRPSELARMTHLCGILAVVMG